MQEMDEFDSHLRVLMSQPTHMTNFLYLSVWLLCSLPEALPPLACFSKGFCTAVCVFEVDEYVFL